jgi:hypothetical protein
VRETSVQQRSERDYIPATYSSSSSKSTRLSDRLASLGCCKIVGRVVRCKLFTVVDDT